MKGDLDLELLYDFACIINTSNSTQRAVSELMHSLCRKRSTHLLSFCSVSLPHKSISDFRFRSSFVVRHCAYKMTVHLPVRHTVRTVLTANSYILYAMANPGHVPWYQRELQTSMDPLHFWSQRAPRIDQHQRHIGVSRSQPLHTHTSLWFQASNTLLGLYTLDTPLCNKTTSCGGWRTLWPRNKYTLCICRHLMSGLGMVWSVGKGTKEAQDCCSSR